MIEIPRTHSTFHLINGSKCFQSPLTQTLSQRWPVPAQFVKDLPPITDILWHLTSLSSLLRIVYCRAGIYLWPRPQHTWSGRDNLQFPRQRNKSHTISEEGYRGQPCNFCTDRQTSILDDMISNKSWWDHAPLFCDRCCCVVSVACLYNQWQCYQLLVTDPRWGPLVHMPPLPAPGHPRYWYQHW